MNGKVAIALASLLLLGAGPFRGCTDESARPLPENPSASCFYDADCVPTGCELVRCVAGQCIEVAPFRDEDGDGVAPFPCGEDCNDSDPLIAPGQRELCDLIDQDCDERIDEDASPSALRFPLTTSDPSMAMAAWENGIVISDATFTRRGIRSRRVDLRGELGTIEPLMDTSRAVVRVEADDSFEGAWFAVVLEQESLEGTQELVLQQLRRGEDGAVMSMDPPILRSVRDVQSLSIFSEGDDVFVGWDEGTDSRHVWSPHWGETVSIAREALGALDLAMDGTHIVVATGTRALAFLSRVDGSLVSEVETSGELVKGQPIASDDGFVWALVNDASGASIQRVDAGMAGPTSVLPGTESHLFGVELTSDGLVVTRASEAQARAWVLSPAHPTEVVRSWNADEISGPAQPIVHVDVTETLNGTAILTNFGAAGSSLAVLACGTER